MSKILIIDDDEAIAEAIQIALDLEGYDTAILTEGQKAQEVVHAYFPDLILLDFLLSGRDGQEITILLKHDPTTASIPIIMLSAHPNAHQSAKASGANDFLSKPFDIGELIKLVEKHLMIPS